MKIKAIVFSLIMALMPITLWAGLTQPAPVTIDEENRIAQGDMVTARFSDNDQELIGCGVRKFSTGEDTILPFAFCQARIAEDVNIICNTQNPELVNAIDSISDYSFVTFSWNEENECTRIGNSTQSFYIPNFKLKKVKKDDDDD